MPYKDQGVQKEYQKLWYLRKKSGLPTRTKVRIKELPEERKRKQKIFNKNLRKYKSKIIQEKLGDKCLICSRDNSLRNHRKDGKRHTDLINICLKSLKIELDSGRFVRLCSRCHGCVHWSMNYLGLTWECIEQKIS